MAKVVQFLEIGNLPKSQLNPCRSRKVMIQNLNFQFQRADQRTIFTTFLNFLCRYPAPKTPPSLGCPPSLLGSSNISPFARFVLGCIVAILKCLFLPRVLYFALDSRRFSKCICTQINPTQKRYTLNYAIFITLSPL